jgi:deoxyribonuclease-4
MQNPGLLGAHPSISKGLHHAINSSKSLGCDTLQIFTKNASTWKEKSLKQNEITRFKIARKESSTKFIASHTSYLINLAGHQNKKYSLSCDALRSELIRSEKLGIDYVVLHPGSHMGKGETFGLDRIAASLNKIFDETQVKKP